MAAPVDIPGGPHCTARLNNSDNKPALKRVTRKERATLEVFPQDMETIPLNPGTGVGSETGLPRLTPSESSTFPSPYADLASFCCSSGRMRLAHSDVKDAVVGQSGDAGYVSSWLP